MADDRVEVKIGDDTTGATSGIKRVEAAIEDLGEALRRPADLIGILSSRLREGLELAGVTDAIDRFHDFGREMTEIGERSLDTGYALGLTTRQVGELQDVFTLAGGNADEAQRAVEGLGAAVKRVFEDPTRAAGTAFHNLGMPLAEAKNHANRPISIEKPGGGGTADDTEKKSRGEAEIFAAEERLKIQEAKGNADKIAAIYDQWLAKAAEVYGQDSKEYLAVERKKVAAAQQAAAARLRAVEEEQREEEELYRKAAEEVTRQWRDATRQISDRLGTVLVDVLDRTKTIGAALRDLADDLLKDFAKGTFSSLLGGSGGTGGALSSLLFGSAGLSGLLGLSSGGLLGLLDSSLGLGGATAAAADVAAMWGGGGEAEVRAGLAGAGATAGGSGLFGGLFSWLSSLFAFGRGGIVPSAAGGWVVPHLADGGILSVLHQREMVLPAPISEGLQTLIANGSGGGGHTINISAIDAGGIARLFSNNGAALVAALNKATRNGSTLYQRS